MRQRIPNDIELLCRVANRRDDRTIVALILPGMRAITSVGRSKKPLQASVSSTHFNSTEHDIESRKQSDIYNEAGT